MSNLDYILRLCFAPIFFCQKITSSTVLNEILCKAIWYKKVKRNKLMKLTPSGGSRTGSGQRSETSDRQRVRREMEVDRQADVKMIN